MDGPAHRRDVANRRLGFGFDHHPGDWRRGQPLWVLMFCPAIWATAAFRPDSDPNLVRSLNDLGFILFNITYAVTSVQAIAAGLVGLADKECAASLFLAKVSCGRSSRASALCCSPRCPSSRRVRLAWNGLLSFWILFGTYFIWTASMGVCMAKDALRRLHEEPDLEAPRQRKMGGAGASA